MKKPGPRAGRAKQAPRVAMAAISSPGIQNMLLNGKPVGEIDVIAAIAGHFGMSVIMLSGDQAAANEIHESVPEAGVAVVKEGIGRRQRATRCARQHAGAWERSGPSSLIR